MSINVKKTLKNIFLGKEFNIDNVDERIKQGADQAGHYSFWVVMLCLFLAMLYGLIFDNIKMSIIPLIIILVGSTANLFFRVKNGSFCDNFCTSKRETKKTSPYLVMGVTYVLCGIVFNIKDIEAFTFESIYPVIVKALINATLMLFFIFVGMKFLVKKNDRVLDKKINKAE